MERLDKHFEKLAAASFARYGFAYGELLARWREIAGEGAAAICLPERIKWPRGASDDKRKLGGTLVLRAEPGRALEVQYQVPVILERVNQFYGFGAISAAVVQQAPRPFLKPLKSRRKNVSSEELQKLQERTLGIADEDLRSALRRLGEGVLAASASSPQDKE